MKNHRPIFTLFLLLLSGIVVAEEVSQKAVLVTGASSGSGRVIAETLAARGYYVYAGARKQADLDALNEIENIHAIRLDVTIQSEIDAAVEAVRQEGKGLYGLVNNAGVAVLGPLIEIPESDIEFVFDVNVYGPYRVTKAFAPLIIESQGRITTTGSISGILSSQFYGPYSMSKHAMEAFTDSLAAEMTKFDVKVSIIEPGRRMASVSMTLSTRRNGKRAGSSRMAATTISRTMSPKKSQTLSSIPWNPTIRKLVT